MLWGRQGTGGWRLVETYPAVSISIKCCSVVPVSSLLLNPLKIPFCSNSALPAACFTSTISVLSILAFGGIT